MVLLNLVHELLRAADHWEDTAYLAVVHHPATAARLAFRIGQPLTKAALRRVLPGKGRHRRPGHRR